MSRSFYCIRKCPIGKPVAEKILNECESGLDAGFDIGNFVDKCESNGCKYKEEMEEFDKKNS